MPIDSLKFCPMIFNNAVFKSLGIAKLLLWMWIATAGASTAQANAHPVMDIIIEADHRSEAILVFLRHIPQPGAQVYLEDALGQHLYVENVDGQQAIAKRYLLQGLPTGQYFLKIEDQHAEIIQALWLHEGEVSIDPAERRLIRKPIFDFAEGQLLLQFHRKQPTPLNIRIVDQEQLVLHEEQYPPLQRFSKNYRFDKIPQGQYQLLVQTKNELYQYPFMIE